MANTAYVGAGTTLGTSYYMRRFMQQMRMHVPPHHAVICPIPPSRVPIRMHCAVRYVPLVHSHMMTIMKQI